MTERWLLALWLSLLLHGALWWLPLRPGQPAGEAGGLTVRLSIASEPAPPPTAAVAAGIPGGSAAASAPVDAPPQPDAGDRMRLGADIYYPARELDRLAQERSAIVLPDVELDGHPPASVLVLVFISETGRVDGVRFEGAAPARLADAIGPVFGAASYQPALKDGVPVKSYKRIRIEPQPEPAALSPALSH
ncbi:hypothetical protein BI347_16800 [Chromobacterium sphagni]|uniref:TonB C-terminal domain-containing protein n=1 Tax=Chromobacterium sphagni TaxID=1903179 RepID=A0A1S1WVM1_9NEIS|nr:hypothetical protein BI347_16800 [Chromobacterium sphagni]OHX18983.1 hypothetical protein BI344_10205 [Chromobacterium sphagni]